MKNVYYFSAANNSLGIWAVLIGSTLWGCETAHWWLKLIFHRIKLRNFVRIKLVSIFLLAEAKNRAFRARLVTKSDYFTIIYRICLLSNQVGFDKLDQRKPIIFSHPVSVFFPSLLDVEFKDSFSVWSDKENCRVEYIWNNLKNKRFRE